VLFGNRTNLSQPDPFKEFCIMARVIDDVEFNGGKKVKKGKTNKVHVKGRGLGLNNGQTLKVKNMKSTMQSGTVVPWTVLTSTITVNSSQIKFDADLPYFVAATTSPASQPKKTNGSETGDITFTLEYTGETDLDVPCPGIIHEEDP
jgi:hypothetical protein